MRSIKASTADGILVATYWKQSVIYLLTQNLFLSQNKFVILKKSKIIYMKEVGKGVRENQLLCHKTI